LIHLDTHVVVWLRGGEFHRFPQAARAALEAEDLAISPMVELELRFLHETGRLSEGPEAILGELGDTAGLCIDATPFPRVARLAATAEFSFTRDPFDRVIAAQAAAARVVLVTKDGTLRQHLAATLWD